MQRRYTLVVLLALSLAGCSAGFGPVTDTPTTRTPTDGAATETRNGTPTDDSTIRDTAALQRVELELQTTAMGQPTSVVNGTVPAGAERTTVDRTVGDNRTTRSVSMPDNWSSRLVGNLDDRQRSQPGNTTVTNDYSQRLTLTLTFSNTTAEIRARTVDGVPARVPVTVGARTYYSDDPALRAVVVEIYRSLSQARDDELGPGS